MGELIMMKQYSGYLGKFEYDDTQWTVKDSNHSPIPGREILHYVGQETDGSKIVVPDGLIHATALFWHTDIVTPPVLPASVKDADFVCYHCAHLVEPIVFSENVESIEAAMAGCIQLTMPSEIPSACKNGQNLYNGCKKLTQAVVVPPGVEKADGMFRDCNALVRFPVKKGSREANEGDWNVNHRGENFRGKYNEVYGDGVLDQIKDNDTIWVAIMAARKYEETGNNVIYGEIVDLIKSGVNVPGKRLREELSAADECYERRLQLQAAKQSKNEARDRAAASSVGSIPVSAGEASASDSIQSILDKGK